MKKEIMEQYYGHYNRRDHESLVSFYTDDVKYEFEDIKISGKEAIADSIGEIQKVLSKDILKNLSILVDGDKVAVEMENEVETTVDLPDFLGRPMKAGEPFTFKVAVFYDCRGDKICHIRIYSF